MQPPSGGCVLKRPYRLKIIVSVKAATFGWLCVETLQTKNGVIKNHAATFGWLCVETLGANKEESSVIGSHLRVAVC